MTDKNQIEKEPRQKKADGPVASSAKKDSTSAIPMLSLEEALKMVVIIHEKALETAPIVQVAKGCGYSNATSTPFYRRLLAARLFKLLGAPQAELTQLALDYLKPDREDAKQAALTRAITAIPAYADLVQRHVGKKINVELVSHSFSRSMNLTDTCATVCANAFVSSLRFAGFIALDGTVAVPAGGSGASVVEPSSPTGSNGEGDGGRNDDDENDKNVQTQTLYLDGKRNRKITIKAPLTVSKEELERIRAWLGFQLIVEEPNTPQPPAGQL